MDSGPRRRAAPARAVHAVPEGALRRTEKAGRVLVIGVGNPYRRDDAVGLVAGRRLAEAARGLAILHEESGDVLALIDAWEGADAAILIDAVRSGAGAGTVHRVDAHEAPVLGRWFRGSTHAFGVAEVIELARALNRLPSRLIVFGVEGKRFASGIGLSPAVERAVDRVVARGLEEIGRSARRGG